MSGFHESLDAALGRAGERDEVEALAEAIDASWSRAEHDPGCPGDEKYCALHCPVQWAQSAGLGDLLTDAARAVLASDWLAQRIEQAKAEERERIASAIEANPFTIIRWRGISAALVSEAQRHAARIAREVPDA